MPRMADMYCRLSSHLSPALLLSQQKPPGRDASSPLSVARLSHVNAVGSYPTSSSHGRSSGRKGDGVGRRHRCRRCRSCRTLGNQQRRPHEQYSLEQKPVFRSATTSNTILAVCYISRSGLRFHLPHIALSHFVGHYLHTVFLFSSQKHIVARENAIHPSEISVFLQADGPRSWRTWMLTSLAPPVASQRWPRQSPYACSLIISAFRIFC